MAFRNLLFVGVITMGITNACYCQAKPSNSNKQISVQNSNGEPATKDKLIGTWTDGSSENATFIVKPNTIYYLEHAAAYKYELAGNKIKIKYPDWTFSGTISFRKDTLVINSEDGPTKFWKFKK